MRNVFFSALTLFILPQIAFGQALVACTGVNCNFCSLAQTVDNVIEWLIAFMVVVAVILLAYAGIRMVTSAGDSGAVQEAKTLFANVVIGIIIILAAWMIVDTLLKALTGSDMGVWNPVDCGGLTPARGLLGYTETNIPGAPSLDSLAGVTPGSVGTGASVTGTLVDYQGRQFDSGVVSQIQALHSAVPGLTLSGGYRTPERNAAVNGSPTSYHLAGRAADFVGSQADMQAGADWANANGAREVLIHNAGSGTHLHVAW